MSDFKAKNAPNSIVAWVRILALCAGDAGGNVTSAGWQVTLCDPMWHVSSRSC